MALNLCWDEQTPGTQSRENLGQFALAAGCRLGGMLAVRRWQIRPYYESAGIHYLYLNACDCDSVSSFFVGQSLYRTPDNCLKTRLDGRSYNFLSIGDC